MADVPDPTRQTVVRDPSAVVAPVHAFLGPRERADELGRLGPYRVLAELGRGGMGIVFRAEEVRLKRQVALKVMLPEAAADSRARARFQREAEAQAKVEHDHIIAIYRVGEVDGVPFIAMPLLKGQTLAAALQQNARPPVDELVRIGREMAEGLAAAHDAGLIHRDIKPSNVWLEGPKRRVKVLDFGLARDATDAPTPEGDLITNSGALVGTPAYMSPEQARSRPVDHRTDLFSLGAVLYEMATGGRPFVGPSAFDVMSAVVEHHPPPAREIVPDLPPALSELIQRLLAKEPTARPSSAGAVVEELTAIARGLAGLPRVISVGAIPGAPNPWEDIDTTTTAEIPSDTTARPRRSRLMLAVVPGVAAALALAGAAAYSLMPERKKDPPVETAESPTVHPEPSPKKGDTVGEKKLPPKTPDPVFFNVRDATRWSAAPAGQWNVEDKPGGPVVVASRLPAQGTPSLRSKQTYADFEVSFTLRHPSSPGHLTLRFRRPPAGGERGGILTFTNAHVVPQIAPKQPFAPDVDHEVKIRCVGKRVTITIDNQTRPLIDEELEIPADGVFTLEYTPTLFGDVALKNIRYTDLGKKP